MSLQCDFLGLGPFGIIIVWLAPSLHSLSNAGIVYLTLEKTSHPHSSIRSSFPVCRISNHIFLGTIGIGNFQTSHHRLLVAEVIPVFRLVGNISTPPSLIENTADGILSLMKHRSNIIGLIHLSDVVLRETWIEIIIADALSIDEDIIDASGGYIETGFLNSL